MAINQKEMTTIMSQQFSSVRFCNQNEFIIFKKKCFFLYRINVICFLFYSCSCGNCDQSCSECDGPTSRDCIACAPGKYLLNSKCIAAVPAGHYSESIGTTNICKNCHHTCSKCTGPLSTDCVTCLGMYYTRQVTI